MAGTTELEKNVLSQVENFSILEAPRKIFYRLCELFYLGSPQCLEPHGILEHGQDQGDGGMGGDDLPFEPLLNQCWQQTDVVDMRMGQKDEIHLGGFEWPIFNGNGRIAPLGDPAVNEDVMPPNLHQPARTGDAILPA